MNVGITDLKQKFVQSKGLMENICCGEANGVTRRKR